MFWKLMHMAPYREADSGSNAGTNPGAGDGGAQGDNPAAEGKAQEGQGEDTRTFTQEDLDRIISDRLKKAEAKWRKAAEVQTSEAARLATLSAEERKVEEFRLQQEKFAAEKAAFEAQRMEMEATKLLAADKLPVEFAGMLKAATAEDTQANIKTFAEAFRAAVAAAVNDRLKAPTPKAGSGKSGDAYTASLWAAAGVKQK